MTVETKDKKLEVGININNILTAIVVVFIGALIAKFDHITSTITKLEKLQAGVTVRIEQNSERLRHLEDSIYVVGPLKRKSK